MNKKAKEDKQIAHSSKEMFKYYSLLKNDEVFKDYIEVIRRQIAAFNKNSTLNFYDQKEYWDQLALVCNAFSLPGFKWQEILHKIAYFNKWDLTPEDMGDGLCKVTSVQEENKRIEQLANLGYESYEQEYPVLLAISPFAKASDIKKHIDDVYKSEIMPRQLKYKDDETQLKKINKRGKQERDSFILENEHLPASKVKDLVKQKYNVTLSYDYINIIKHRERKKRNIKK